MMMPDQETVIIFYFGGHGWVFFSSFFSWWCHIAGHQREPIWRSCCVTAVSSPSKTWWVKKTPAQEVNHLNGCQVFQICFRTLCSLLTRLSTSNKLNSQQSSIYLLLDCVIIIKSKIHHFLVQCASHVSVFFIQVSASICLTFNFFSSIFSLQLKDFHCISSQRHGGGNRGGGTFCFVFFIMFTVLHVQHVQGLLS